MKLLGEIGRYSILIRRAFAPAEKKRVYYQQIIYEMYELGIRSLPFVLFISLFVGAVLALQTASNIDNPLIPKYLVGFATRESMILEFSPTIISLLLAGKIGSNIASGIGTMRISEQIDALEIMGINSAGYLIFPKIIALVVINPFIIILSITFGMVGGWLAVITTGIVPEAAFLEGITFQFEEVKVYYSFIKTVFFAFLIATIPAYYGYYTSGGALGIGKSSTKAVVNTSIVIILFNLIITNIFLG
ncbi:MAG: ABC transporter permease [Flavobacteriales bacterium]|jgi:phospholipid/cholesterol/gamma-HCH transport system permease protein|nr:ABC transporter permease [Flavobacteriales bacterium]